MRLRELVEDLAACTQEDLQDLINDCDIQQRKPWTHISAKEQHLYHALHVFLTTEAASSQHTRWTNADRDRRKAKTNARRQSRRVLMRYTWRTCYFVAYLDMTPDQRMQARERFSPRGRRGKWREIQAWAFAVRKDGHLASCPFIEPVYADHRSIGPADVGEVTL